MSADLPALSAHLEHMAACAADFAAALERVRAALPTPEEARTWLEETASSMDGPTCGCGTWDCGECGPRLAGGWRPAKGARLREARLHEAAMQTAREQAHRAGH